MTVKYRLWRTETHEILCFDHILDSEIETGQMMTPFDYAELLNQGIRLECSMCRKASTDDEARLGTVHLLFRKNSAAGLARSRDAHPSRGKDAQGTYEKGETS
jgi:hypothetical protein